MYSLGIGRTDRFAWCVLLLVFHVVPCSQGVCGNSQLLHAAEVGDTDLLWRLLSQAEAVNSIIDGGGWTPLMVSAVSGQARMVRLLLHNGAKPNTTDEDSWTVLMYAAARGHSDVVRALLYAGAWVNVADPTGWTALHASCPGGNLEIIRMLLAANAEIDAVQEDKGTTLCYAASRNYFDMVKELIWHGAMLPDKHSLAGFSRKMRRWIIHNQCHFWAFLTLLLEPKGLPPDLEHLIITFVNGDRW